MSADGNKISIGDVAASNNFGVTKVYNYPNQLYDIKLVNILSSFTDASHNLPEVELTYVNSVSPDGGWYGVTVLDGNCSGMDNTSSIVPRQNGNYSGITTNDVTVQLDVNTSLVMQANYYTPGATEDTGTLEFCTKIDYYNKHNVSVATETNKIKLELDQRTTFSTKSGVSSTGPATETVHYVDFEYTTQTYFCDDSNQEVVPGPRAPGQLVQFCGKFQETLRMGHVFVTNSQHVAFGFLSPYS